MPPKVEAYDLKGIKLGCNLDQFRECSPFKDDPSPDSGNTAKIEVPKSRLLDLQKTSGTPFTVATIEPNFLWFHFVKKDDQWRLYKMRVEFLTDQAGAILDGLTTRYGAPTSIERVAKRNAVGAEFQSRDAVWDNEFSQIYFREIAAQVGKGDLLYVHKELENAELTQPKPVKAPADL